MAAKRNKLVLGLILILYIAATSATSTSTCTVEFDTNYDGAKANDVYGSPKQPDWQSCQSFCKSNYPSALFFKHNLPTNDPSSQFYQTCACKTTKTGSTASAGKVSGEVNCAGVGEYYPQMYVGTYAKNINILLQHIESYTHDGL